MFSFLNSRTSTAYLDTLSTHCISGPRFDRICETLCRQTPARAKNCIHPNDHLLKSQITNLLFRSDDPSRTWQQRYEALKSSVLLNKVVSVAVNREYPLRSKNIIAIQQHKQDALFPYNIGLQDNYNVFMEKYGNRKNRDICDILNTTRALIGKPLDAALIQGHGSKDGIRLDDWTVLNSDSFKLDKVASCFQKHLKEGSPIFFKSCNTGNRVQYNTTLPSIAELAAALTGHSVFAPTQILRDSECSFRPDPVTGIKLWCDKKMSYNNDEPRMSLGPYIKRFDPISEYPSYPDQCLPV